MARGWDNGSMALFGSARIKRGRRSGVVARWLVINKLGWEGDRTETRGRRRVSCGANLAWSCVLYIADGRGVGGDKYGWSTTMVLGVVK